MHRPTNASETLPFRGDAINEFFAQCYKASLRTPHRTLRFQKDSVMQLWARRARPRLVLADILLVLKTRAVTPETHCYLAALQAAYTRTVSKLPRVPHDVYAESVISGIAFSKAADQPGLTAGSAKWRLFRARRNVKHARQSVIQRRAA